MTTAEQAQFSTGEDFAALLAEALGTEDEGFIGRVMTGTVVKLTDDDAIVDVGLKSEGRVPLKEFGVGDVTIGDTVDVYVDRYENKDGLIVLSREKARREEAWIELEKQFNEGKRVDGTIFGRVKGGFTVDLSGAVAFLPGSQVDIRPVRDVTPLMNNPQPFQILKMDRSRGNIVVSRRAVLEETRAEQRAELIQNLQEGQVLDGVVKNITDYGAFKIVSTSQEVEVMVLDVDAQKRRISLGLKQCTSNPWDAFLAAHPVGAEIEGEVKNITEFGLFIGLLGGIDGMAHLSDLSWDRAGEEVIKEYKKGDIVKAKVLDVDVEKERISLGIKQLAEDPFKEAVTGIKRGEAVTCEITEVNDGGIEVAVGGTDLKGFIRKAELARDRSDQRPERFAVGEKIDARVTTIDAKTRKVTLSVKALEVADEKKAMADYGSADSGASLGDILGEAMRKKQEGAE